jgi:hypothetical protein
VVPWNDLLEVKLAVTRPNVSAIASAIEDFDGRNSLMRDVVGTKQVSATQCGGYGLIEIRQHDFYFNR